MLLTAPLLSKSSSFFGSLLNKCRQVVSPIKKPSTNITNNNNFTPTTTNPQTQLVHPTTPNIHPDNHASNRPAAQQQIDYAVAKLSLSTPLAASGSGVKTLEEQVGLPPRPKKPLTPYFRFLRETRPKIVADNPQITNIALIKLASKQWETTDVSVKERLQAEYKQEKQVYVERRAKYDSEVSDEKRAQIKQLKQDISEAKERRAMRRRIRELGRPKKPASAFLRFLSKERERTPQGAKQTYRDWHEKATARWVRLKDSEKQVHLDAVRIELDKYKKDLAAWEEKMIRLGHVEVVRQGNLIDVPDTKTKK